MSGPETMLDEPVAGLSPAEIWGERAQQLVDYVKSQKPPVAKKASVHVFATRKGWEGPTLAGILAYCVEHKLLVAYQAVSGPAFKIPLTPVFDQADDDLPPARSETPAPAPSSSAADCLCARTAPKVNCGCPVHGGARVSKPKKEKPTMAKDWITTAEAAELLGLSGNRVLALIKDGKLTAKPDDQHEGGGRKPYIISRASVIALRDARKTGATAKAPPQHKQTAIVVAREAKPPAKVKKPSAAPKSSVTSPKAQVVAGDLADDVRALVHNVARGWMTAEDVIAHLAELVA